MAANQEAEAAVLLLAGKNASLATIRGGVPHASLVTPAWDEGGAPVLLLSALAAHTRHLAANPACALLVLGASADANPQTIPRVSLSGTASRVEQAAVQERYLKTHPYAAPYADFADFGYWRIDVLLAQFIGGFGRAGDLDVAALQHEISALLRGGCG